MFYDLKDGATIVSLQPLVAQSFKMSQTNVSRRSPAITGHRIAADFEQCDSFDAIIKITKHQYLHSWVSWKAEQGNYYLQEVDRSMRKRFEQEMTSRQTAS